MTAFTTPCCENATRRRLLVVLLALPLLTFAPGAVAEDEEARIRSAAIVLVDDSYVLNADFDVPLNPRLVDAVRRGVSLYFNIELNIDRPRRLWFDSRVVEKVLQYRLSYHPVTRSYRLSTGNFHRSYDTLDGAIRTLTRVRSWRILASADLKPGIEYQASLRFVHDKSMLPRPLLVTARGTREWTLASDWVRWNFSAEGDG
ncbi:MAG TPA: DUF4390 domain-containing protein [Azoarcus sp.]|nr:DUF4390 domain-containing protein [Azoarcus sp.]